MKTMYSLIICIFTSVSILSSCNSDYTHLPDTTDLNSNPESTPNLPELVEEKTEGIPVEELENNIESSEPTMQITDIPQVEFGYANIDGTKIIVLYDHEFHDNKLLTHFRYAVGEDGDLLEIEYDLFQKSNPDGNGRQTMWNFDNEQGCIYTVNNALASANSTYVLLTKEEFEKIEVFQHVEKAETKESLCELKEKCEKIINRGVKNCWLLSEYSNNDNIAIVVFENIGDDLLAWLTLDDGDVFRYCEFPARLDGSRGWSEDDHGELMESYFTILCTIQKEQSTIVYLIWYDFDGSVIFEIEFFEYKTPNKRIVSSRCTAPI